MQGTPIAVEPGNLSIAESPALWMQRSMLGFGGFAVPAVAVGAAVKATATITATAGILPRMRFQDVFIVALLWAESGAPRGPGGDRLALVGNANVAYHRDIHNAPESIVLAGQGLGLAIQRPTRDPLSRPGPLGRTASVAASTTASPFIDGRRRA